MKYTDNYVAIPKMASCFSCEHSPVCIAEILCKMFEAIERSFYGSGLIRV